jgi:20S proteasome alpha/beta subunit
MENSYETTEFYRRQLRKFARWQTSSSLEHASHKMPKSDTTIVLDIFDDDDSKGAVVACDGQVSGGGYLIRSDEDKIMQLDLCSIMAGTGYVIALEEGAKIARAVFQDFKFVRKSQKGLSAQAKASQLAGIASSFWSSGEAYFAGLFATYDPIADRARIFEISPWGEATEKNRGEQYASDGSGGSAALEVLRGGWRSGMSRDEAIRLAVYAIHRASHDVHTANEPRYVKIVSRDRNIADRNAGCIEILPSEEVKRVLEEVRKGCNVCVNRGGER